MYHGEKKPEEEEGVGNEEFFNEQFDGLEEGLNDVVGVDLFNIGPTSDFVGNE